jgi:hypothetical protein
MFILKIPTDACNILQYLKTISVPGTILASGLFMGIGKRIIMNLKLKAWQLS